MPDSCDIGQQSSLSNSLWQCWVCVSIVTDQFSQLVTIRKSLESVNITEKLNKIKQAQFPLPFTHNDLIRVKNEILNTFACRFTIIATKNC